MPPSLAVSISEARIAQWSAPPSEPANRAFLRVSAWTYRHPPRVGKVKLYRLEQTSPEVREIAWKAQTWLTARYRALSARGKKTTVVCTAIARALVGFVWSVGRLSQPNPLGLR